MKRGSNSKFNAALTGLAYFALLGCVSGVFLQSFGGVIA